jgi:ABC-2 type transport system permease protein
MAFAMTWLGTIARVAVLWLPAQLLRDSRLFAEQGGFLAFAVVGTSIMGFFMASYGGFAGAIRNEQAMGTLEAVLMTPATLTSVVLGSNSWNMLSAMVDALLMLGVGALLFGLEFHGSLAAALLIVVLTNLSFAAFGILSAAFTIVFKRGDPFRVVVGGASFLLGGVVYPIEILPGWIQGLSQLLPVTHGVRALREILLQGQPLATLSTEVAILCAFAAVGLPLSVTCFGMAVRRAKRDGTLLQY